MLARPMSRPLVAALAALLCAPSPARAYNEALHALIAPRALAQRTAWLTEPIAPPAEADVSGFRARFFRAALAGDPALRAKLLAKSPDEARFDAWAFKQLLLLNPAATVHGFDLLSEDAKPLPRGALLALASRWPDDDQRNRDRLLRDARGAVVPGPDGGPIPFDPATLDLGALTGTSSQGHAHYGILETGLSDDPDVLKKDPRHFAMPKTTRSWGAWFAQLYTDLAIAAAAEPGPGREWLVAAFAGAAFHHLEDLCNQIHTVQVGLYDFFASAELQRLEHDARTLGGLLGPRSTLKDMGLHLIKNHHLLSEDLFAKRLTELAEGKTVPPEIAAAGAGLGEDDAAFLARAEAAVAAEGGARGPFGHAIAETLIDVSSREAADVYRHAYAFSSPELHDALGFVYDGPPRDDPDNFLAPPSPEVTRAISEFYVIEARGLRRAGTALRLWQRLFTEATAGDAEAARARSFARTLAYVVPYDDEAAARRAAWRPEQSAPPGIAWGWPLGLAALVLGAGLLFVRGRSKKAT